MEFRELLSARDRLREKYERGEISRQTYRGRLRRLCDDYNAIREGEAAREMARAAQAAPSAGGPRLARRSENEMGAER